MNQTERFIDAWQHTQRRVLGVAKRSMGVGVEAAMSTAADPVGSGMGVLEATQSAARLLKPAPSPMSPLMTGRSLSQRFNTLTVPLTDTKLAAKTAGGKLNDAFVAGVAGGFRRYHDRHESPASALRMSMPINIRNESTENDAGNQFSPARFPVPLTVRDPVHRMKVVSDLVGRARAEPALALTQPLAGALNQLPRELTTALFGSMLKGVDFVTSNVPGAPFPVYLAGARIQSQFAFGPMTGAAANITLLSYVDELNMGFNTDPAAIPDIDDFMDCMREGFDEVLKAG
ncbi:MAG: WS/DGAT domain-containing protein, partial [Actinomycetota bacterium]